MSTFHLKAHGVTYEGRQAIVRKLKSGDPLFFVPDPTNIYDDHAVEIRTQTNEQVGFVSAEKNRQIFENIMYGRGHYDVTVSEVTGGGFGSNYGCNIKVVYTPGAGKPIANADYGNDDDEPVQKERTSSWWKEEDFRWSKEDFQSKEAFESRAEKTLIAPFVNLDGKMHELYCLFRDCKYRKIVDYFDEREIESVVEALFYLYGLLFTGDYEYVLELSDAIADDVEASEEAPLDDLLSAQSMPSKICCLLTMKNRTLDLIKNCAERAGAISEFLEIAKQKAFFDRHSYRGPKERYSEQEAKDYFAKMCFNRNESVSNEASLEDLQGWCLGDDGIDELLAFGTAEYFFNQPDYGRASLCYLLAASANCSDPRYYAYFGQCMFRAFSVADGGLMAGCEATKIAIMLEPDNAEWHIMQANLLSRIQMFTPFNVLKLFDQELEFAADCPNTNEETIETLRKTRQKLFEDIRKGETL